ncbi:MAG: RNA polymerase sigma factor [Bacteroidales bacterium]|nr:RNA polymerase sigma factor [Bacteroidales bacterium]MDP2235519.1 RNA polymerase sigma factor [Bacteroidales bacterium]
MFKIKSPNYKQLADEKLIVAIANGDSAAFNELYKRYNERMLYYFYRMLWNDRELAQDFLQDLFFKIIDKPHLFDVERKFSTWIFSIAHNMCKNEYRNRVVRDIIEEGADTDIILYDEEPVNYSSLQIEDVFNCLHEFDEMHRTAFLLKYREGLSIDEISAILELPVGTIKSRLFYTRKRIQKKLQHKIHSSNEY